MTFKEFIDKHNGKFLDMNGFPKENPFQCMDLMRFYLRDVLKLGFMGLPPAKYAKQVFQNFKASTKFQKIYNTPVNVPQRGDIVFWGTYPLVTGIAGHVAIFWDGDVRSFVSFDQNYPTKQPCKLVRHSYRGVMGWLRPIK